MSLKFGGGCSRLWNIRDLIMLIYFLEKQTEQITTERNGVNLNKYSRLHVVHGTDVMTHMPFLFSFRLCQGISQEKAFCILAWQMKKMIQLYKR